MIYSSMEGSVSFVVFERNDVAAVAVDIVIRAALMLEKKLDDWGVSPFAGSMKRRIPDQSSFDVDESSFG